MILIIVLCLFPFLGTVFAIPVDNAVLGEPEVECGSDSLIVVFDIKNVFEGHVFVKGLYSDPECHVRPTGRLTAAIQIPLSSCGTQRVRSANPRGIFVSTTVIISFHPFFITKVDRAYRIQCFYMEADKTVDSELEVSMLTTGVAEFQHPMPVCRYEILDGGPDGRPVRYAVVGEQVYHKWTCDSDADDTFCMTVHTCFVDDGQGDRVELLDENGCAIDRHLLDNLEYPTDLMAGKESHVFKYADRPALFFNCQVSITIKEPNQACPRNFGVRCPDLGALRNGPRLSDFDGRRPFNIRRLGKRNVDHSKLKLPVLATVDVASGELEILNDFNHDSSDIFDSRYSGSVTAIHRSPSNAPFCFGPVGFSVLLTTYGLLIVTLFGTVCGYLYFRKRKSVEQDIPWWAYGLYGYY